MQSYLHCHSKNLHSIILGHNTEGNVVRMFVADIGHELEHNSLTGIQQGKQTLTLHDHKTDITIYPIMGEIHNVFVEDSTETSSDSIEVGFNTYSYHSAIVEDTGKFISLDKVQKLSIDMARVSQPIFIPHDQLHTICVTSVCASWVVVEGNPINKAQQVCYSSADLSDWTDEGMYVPMTSDQEENLKDIFFFI